MEVIATASASTTEGSGVATDTPKRSRPRSTEMPARSASAIGSCRPIWKICVYFHSFSSWSQSLTRNRQAIDSHLVSYLKGDAIVALVGICSPGEYSALAMSTDAIKRLCRVQIGRHGNQSAAAVERFAFATGLSRPYR
jgi:hypothetical protein